MKAVTIKHFVIKRTYERGRVEYLYSLPKTASISKGWCNNVQDARVFSGYSIDYALETLRDKTDKMYNSYQGSCSFEAVPVSIKIVEI